MELERQNKILVVHGARRKLMTLFNTTYPTVRGALNGNTSSELARKIRKAALTRFNGVEMPDSYNTNQ